MERVDTKDPTEREQAFVAIGILTAAVAPLHDMLQTGNPGGVMSGFWEEFLSCVKDVDDAIERHRYKINEFLGLV